MYPAHSGGHLDSEIVCKPSKDAIGGVALKIIDVCEVREFLPSESCEMVSLMYCCQDISAVANTTNNRHRTAENEQGVVMR